MSKRILRSVLASGALAGASLVGLATPAAAVTVSDEASFRAAWTNAAETQIDLSAGITLANCGAGEPTRNSATALTVNGNGHTIHQSCPGQRVLAQLGTGALALNGVTVSGGDSPGIGGGVVAGGALTVANSTLSGNTTTAGSPGGGLVGFGAVTIAGSKISGNTSGGDGGGLVSFDTITVTGSAITGNTANGGNGGGGGVAAGNLSVADSVISGNTALAATAGAGGIGSQSAATITRSTVTGNTSSFGAGVAATTSLAVTDSAITANTATGGNGAGGAAAQGDVTITRSVIAANSAPGSAPGGGVLGGTVTVTSSTITGNKAGFGGGVNSQNGASFTDSAVSGNTADGDGGGVLAGGSATLSGTTVSGNTGNGSGGGISAPAATLTNSTVSGNTAGRSGGGISAGTVNLVYSTIVGGSAPAAANILTSTDTLVPFASVVALPQGGGANCVVDLTTSNGFNFSDDGSCQLGGSTDRQNAGDPSLGPLASNGGPTQTRLPEAGSPLVDVIPAASCRADGAGGVTADQRGVTRPQGTGCDVGAVEVQGTVAPPAPAPSPAVPRFTG